MAKLWDYKPEPFFTMPPPPMEMVAKFFLKEAVTTIEVPRKRRAIDMPPREEERKPEPVTMAAGTRRYVKVDPHAIGFNRRSGGTAPTCRVIESETGNEMICHSVEILGRSSLVYGVPADEPQTVREVMGCGGPVEVENRQVYIQTNAELVVYL